MGYSAVLNERRGVSTQGFNLPLQWSGAVISPVSPCSLPETSSAREQKANGKGVDGAKTHRCLSDDHSTQAPLSTTAPGELLYAHKLSPSDRPTEQIGARTTVQTAR